PVQRIGEPLAVCAQAGFGSVRHGQSSGQSTGSRYREQLHRQVIERETVGVKKEFSVGGPLGQILSGWQVSNSSWTATRDWHGVNFKIAFQITVEADA